MSDYITPIIKIGGKTVTGDQVDGLTAVREMRIKWGSDNWFSDVDPAELTLELIDPWGEFPDLIRSQTPVTVSFYYDLKTWQLFTGTVETVTAQYVGEWLNNHWRISLTALDPTAQLARDRNHGPQRYQRPRDAKNNTLLYQHWTGRDYAERCKDLQDRCPVAINWPAAMPMLPGREAFYANAWSKWDINGDDSTEIFGSPVSGYDPSANVSVLTVLRNTARMIDFLARPYYNANREQIEFHYPAQTPVIGRLSQTAKGLQSTRAQLREIIPGEHCAPVDGLKLTNEPIDTVNRVEISYRPQKYIENDATKQQYWGTADDKTVAVSFETTKPQITAQITTDSGSEWSTPHWSNSQLDQLRTLLSKLDDKTAPPPFTIHAGKISVWLEESTPITRLAVKLLNTAPSGYAYTLVNNLLGWRVDTAPFEIVGGEIAYTPRKHWRVTVNPAVSPRTNESTARVSDITLNIPFQDYKGNDLVADWLTL